MSIAEVLFTTATLRPRDAAFAFADAGIPVFPCLPDGKRPLTKSGFLDASTDVGVIGIWWSKWPTANLGMPTGTASGVDVVDIDTGANGSGFPALERAQQNGLVDGELARVRTPSGGMHVYFPADPARPQRCWQAASAHVDFRGEGGYVIVPPSSLPTGNTRTAYRVSSLSSAPQHPVDAGALRDFIAPRPTITTTRTVTSDELGPTRLATWVSRLQEGERNHGLFWASCRLVEAGHTPGGIVNALGAAAASVGLSEREIAITIRSAVRHASPAARTPASSWREPETPAGRRGDAPCLR
ncbi:bifunctional DNA primase/polymerase [Agromyces seonyuensis]|uniref:DNA primase n=1 Tax=Agromyces seonyuensis TaxID=2662446 RepID=A0A6I4P4X4_9MICO|nr:bifunctional DNA primase/polymerase [Agromyces seonyuensis]MWB99419.1 DNA primase [Agromyces seonyuensis]